MQNIYTILDGERKLQVYVIPSKRKSISIQVTADLQVQIRCPLWFTEMNHSPAFWSVVAAVLPDYAERRKWLKTHESGRCIVQQCRTWIGRTSAI